MAERERFSGLLEQTPAQVVDVTKKIAEALLVRTSILEKIAEQRGEFPSTPQKFMESFEKMAGPTVLLTADTLGKAFDVKESESELVLSALHLIENSPVASQFALGIMDQSFGKQLVTRIALRQKLDLARAQGRPLDIFEIYRDRSQSVKFLRSDMGFFTMMAAMWGGTLGPGYLALKVVQSTSVSPGLALGVSYGAEFAGLAAMMLKDIRVSFRPSLAREQYAARSNLKKGTAAFRSALREATPMLGRHGFDHELEQFWADWRAESLSATRLSPREREGANNVSERLLATSFLVSSFSKLELGNGQTYKQGRKALQSPSEIIRSSYQNEVVQGLARKLKQLSLIRFELEQLKSDIDAGLHDENVVAEDHRVLGRLIDSYNIKLDNPIDETLHVQDRLAYRRLFHLQSELAIKMLTDLIEAQTILLAAQKEAFESGHGDAWINSQIGKKSVFSFFR